MDLPNKIVYAIRAASARRHMRCRVNDNTLLRCTPKAFPIPLHFTAAKKGTFYTRLDTPKLFSLFFLEELLFPWNSER
jgi:hypothetical protein